MNYTQARERTLAAGATDAEIQRYADNLTPSVPTRNMIVALQLHPWLNSADDWARLAGAMLCRKSKSPKL
jgi:hypothetical protein